jgi:diguanylate cyclase (GGDEF)-like protein
VVVVPLAALYVAATVWPILGHFDPSLLAATLDVAAVALTAARAVHRPEQRLVWALAALAMTSWMAGNIVYFAATSGAGAAGPTPADVFWLSFYPLMIAATVVRIRTCVLRGLQGGVVLDGVIAGCGACALVASFAAGPLLGHLHGSVARVVVNTAYPVGDELLLGMAVGVLAVSGRGQLSRAWVAMAVAQTMYMAGDTLLLTRTANGSYKLGTSLDTLWVVAGLVVALGAWQRPKPIVTVAATGWRILVVPYVFTGAALFVVVRDHWVHGSTVTVVLAAATLVVAAGRTSATLRQLRLLGEARREAATDDLTGLPNRRELIRTARSARERDAGSTLWLLMLDIDLFKDINDSLGHQAGDDLIRRIAPRLVSAVRPADLVARVGSGGFAILLEGGTERDAVEVADRLRREVALPTSLAGAEIVVNATIGVAGAPVHTEEVDDLFRYADTAMYRARARRLGVAVFDEPLDRRDTDRLLLITELRRALHTGEIVLVYQPKATLVEGALIGVEALVRWQHPRLGLLVPSAFLPLAEQAGLMRRLTEHVLELAIAQAATWTERELHICVSVNVTAQDVRDEDFPDLVAAKLALHGVDPHMLMLEITEQDLVLDRQQGAGTLDRLRESGVRVSIDDYGTGYSSLSYLCDLPVDELKLDREFVRRMLVHERAGIVVRSSVQLAKSLGLTIVAEGVETLEEWHALRDAGCDVAQGYLLGRPMAPVAFDEWLALRSAVSALPGPRPGVGKDSASRG